MTIVSPGTLLAYTDLFGHRPTSISDDIRFMMRSFRWVRAGRRRSAHRAAAAGADPLAGLDAFASETPSPRAECSKAGSLWRPGLMPAILAALVLVQAVPTVLWLRGLLARENPSLAAAAAPQTPPESTIPPVPDSEDGAADRPAATSGSRGSEERTPPTTPPPPARREERRAPVPQPAGPPAIVAGLLAVDAPVPMQILQRGRIVGTTEAETIMLPVGTHDLEFVSDAVGYRVRRTVAVQAGRTTRVQVPATSGTLHVNAVPWAEVWIDGRAAGETPLGNLQAPVGTREIVFRHPELGERRRTVLVTLTAPARVSVDLGQP